MNTFYEIIDTSLKSKISKVYNPFNVNREFFDFKGEDVYLKREKESSEEYTERIESYTEFEIGTVYIDNKRHDFYTNIMYLDFGIYGNISFYIPKIALLYMYKDSKQYKIYNGKYPLVAKLKVYNNRIYIDINNIYLKEERKLIKINTLVYEKIDYESNDEFEKRINFAPYFNLGAVKLREDIYIEDGEILPIKIALYKWLKIQNDYVKSFIRIRKEDVKKLSFEHSTIPLYGKIAVFEGEIQIVDTFIYIEEINRIEAINIEGVTFLIEDFLKKKK